MRHIVAATQATSKRNSSEEIRAGKGSAVSAPGEEDVVTSPRDGIVHPGRGQDQARPWRSRNSSMMAVHSSGFSIWRKCEAPGT